MNPKAAKRIARRRRGKFRVIEDFGGRRAQTRHAASRCLYARAGDTVAMVAFVRIVHRAGATAEYCTTTARTSCSTVLQSSEGPARSTAELAVVGVVVGTKAHLSAIHRRSFPSLKAGYTVDAHIEALVDERDVATLLFRPGALFTPEGPVHCQVH